MIIRMIIRRLTAALLLPLVVSACTDRSAPPNAAPAANSSAGPVAATPKPDQWLGQWTGPEGTFLRLEGGDGRYTVTIQDLDGPRTFQGVATGDRIEFERNGQKESLRATNGQETGMKWLLEKSNCLTIKSGEGYCRD